MGKYKSIPCDTQSAVILRVIANELAEQNRLERYKINNGAYNIEPKTPLEDEA